MRPERGGPAGGRCGGGLTGCEIAYDLILKDKSPVIVEILDDILKVHGLSAANSNMLRDIFHHRQTPLYLEARLLEIRDKEVVLEVQGEQKTIPADTVISSIGYLPSPLTGMTRKVHLVGDAVEVGNLLTVIWGAYDLVTGNDAAFG